MFESKIANILILFYSVLMAMNTYVFLYQRTVRKVYMSYPKSKEFINMLYPSSYLVIFYISQLRYILLVVTLFYSWSLALLAAVVGWILGTWWPSRSDYKDILIMKSHLYKIKDVYNRAVVEQQLNEIIDKYYSEIPKQEYQNSTIFKIFQIFWKSVFIFIPVYLGSIIGGSKNVIFPIIISAIGAIILSFRKVKNKSE